jgi:hypothetical protein
LPEHNPDLPFIFQNIENDHDLPNLELTGTVGSHRVLDGSNEAIQYFSCFLLMTFFRKFENGPRKLQTQKFSDPDKNIG